MSNSHHDYPQHTQSRSLLSSASASASAPYTPAPPLRLPVTYAPTPYPHGVFGIHHPLSSATYPPVPSPYHADTYRGPLASMPPSPQGPLPSVRMLNLQGQPPTTASHHYGMAIASSPVSPSMGGGLSPTIGFFGVPVPQIGYNAYMSPHMFARPSNKKEIKRRTKTGCLTCRKRRIKCDEGRPLCNNCRKSKRECRGYDHVVKQTGSATPIQPAPSRPSLLDQTPLISPASATSPDTTIHSPFGAHFGHERSHATSTTVKPDPLDYYPVDPVLHSSAAAISRPAQPVPRLSQPTPAYLSSAQQQQQQQHRFALGANVAGGIAYHPPSPAQSIPDIASSKMMRVNDVISSMGTAPAPRPVHVTDHVFKQVVAVYHEIYSPGLVRFFEMSWFSFKEQGHDTFPRDQSVVEKLAACLEIFQGVSVTDHTAMGVASLLETQMIWNLVTMAHTIHPSLLPPDNASLVEIRNRVLIVSALLSGEYLFGDASTRPAAVSDPRRSSEFEFWDGLWEFLTLKDPTNESAAHRAKVLERLRARVDGRENRDILYSLAVIRALAPQYPPGFEKGLPQHRDESDPRCQLWVAIEFLQNESRVSGGVTNVARRLAEVGLRALVNPGACIRRPPAVA